MRVEVEFGGEPWQFDVADDRWIELRPMVHTKATPPIEDLAAAVAAALESPHEFPPLRQAVVPGDHVALVLDAGVARPAELLGSIIECLIGAGVLAGDIRVVEATRAGAVGLATDELPPGISLLKHDPADRDRLSYLAVTNAGTRVYLNREVVDADLVVLIGRVEFDPILGFRGTASSLFPDLADEAAGRQFRARIALPQSRQLREAARREVNEVAWLLGAQFAVQVVLGASGDVTDVIAGHGENIQRHAEQLLLSNRRRTAAARADLVIAAISGDPARQGFEELGAALAAASQLVREDGRIAVLSSIATPPGPALASLRGTKDPGAALDQLRKHPGADLVSAWQLASTAAGASVYLKSRLPDELAQGCFMTPLADHRELQRLVDHAGSRIVLADAQLLQPTVEVRDA